MKKNTFLYLPVVTVIFLFSCGGEKNTTEETPAKDSTQHNDTTVVDTTTEDLSSTPPSPHPVSEWAQRNAQHPYFYSASVDELVNGKAAYTPNEDEMMDYTHDHLNKAEMARLTTKELLYYCLKYPCSFAQICAADEFQDTTDTPKIIGFMPFTYSGDMRSEWQNQALEKKRDSVIIVLNNYIKIHPEDIAAEYLNILLDLKSVESVPTIIKTAAENNHNYTYLLVLMFETKYAPFQNTGMCRQLYGDDSWRYGSRIDANKANIDSIKTLATQMHKAYKKK